MGWFDAIFHAFSTLALGGFSTYDASVGHFDSAAIEFVLIVFMLISAMNFARHFIAWQQKSLRTYVTDVEAVAMLGIIGIATVGVALYIWLAGVYPEFLTALRHTAFNLVSIATDCGFVTPGLCGVADVCADGHPDAVVLLREHGIDGRRHQDVPHPGAFPAGGARAVPAGAPASRDARKDRRPGRRQQDRVRRTRVRGAVLRHSRHPDLHAARERARLHQLVLGCHCLHQQRRSGTRRRRVRPATSRCLTDFQTWVCSLAMLLGRLEIFSMLVLFTPTFWRK